MDQYRSVPRQCRRTAGNVDDGRRRVGAQRLDQRNRAITRRVDQHLVEAAQRGDALRGGLEQVGDAKFRVAVQPVQCRVGLRLRHQRSSTLDADHLRAAPGDRQGEVAQAAEHVGDALVLFRRQERHRAAHQHAVDAVVDLGEIQRRKAQFDGELGQGIGQRRRALGMKQRERGRPARLQVQRQTMPLGKLAQAALVTGADSLQYAQHENLLAVADGDLDLRDTVGNRQAGDQAAQFRQQCGNIRRQHFARLHGRDITAALLVKSDQHAALLRYQPHRQPRPLAVAPGRTVDRRIQHFGVQTADMPESVLEHALLGRCLGRRLQMLHAAAAADAEIPAARFTALCAGLQNAERSCLLVTGLSAEAGILDFLAGQGALDEYRLAFDVGDAATFVV